MKDQTKCGKCGEARDYTIKSGKRAGKLHTYCRKCLYGQVNDWTQRNREHAREKQRKWWNENPTAKIRAHMRRYGSDEHWYFDKLSAQNGLCAICHKAEGQRCKNRLSADHCHSSGRLRGLLCNKCNMALHFLENSGWLAAAQAYLQKYQC